MHDRLDDLLGVLAALPAAERAQLCGELQLMDRTPAACIGAAVREARERAGRTRQELGDHLGVTASAVSRLESGQSSLAADRLVRIASWLGVDPAALLRGVE